VIALTGDPSATARLNAGRRLRVLTFTSLFPSEAMPRHGIFVETRLKHLVRDCPVDARVVAPVPWFPFRHPRFGRYARYAATPRRAVRPCGLEVRYPRYLMLPGVGMHFQPDSMARAASRDLAELISSGWQPDIIDAHYLYPDGVAAASLARSLGVPLVLTARGSDVNLIADLPGPRARILDACRHADAVIAVSSALRDRLVALGVEAGKVSVLRNGVDAELFRPADGAEARARLGLPADGPLLASVGNLLPVKGQALAIEALQHLPACRLVVVGEGPLRDALEQQARRLGVAERVLFRPSMPQHELRYLYAASDLLLLTSQREGWPNVVLEAMACGTPVVATDAGAVREMISDDRVGTVLRGREAAELAAAVNSRLERGASRDAVRAHAMTFGWESISAGVWALLSGAVERHGRANLAAA